MFGPNPRFRLYTTPSNYISILGDKLKGRLNEGDDVDVLENELKQFLGCEYVLCMPQNRVGMYLLVKHLIELGQEVVMSPYTIADITNMVILAGGRPVFADVDRETCNIATAEVEASISDNTGAVLITHLHGLAAPVEEVKALCEARNVPLIEDSAQGFGAKLGSKRLGTLGIAGVFSFGSFKNVNGWLGGAVCSDDGELIASIREELVSFDYQRHDLLLKKVKKGLVSDIATYPPLFKLFTFWVFRYGFLHDIEAINRKVRTELDAGARQSFPEEYRARMTPAQARLIRPQLATVDKFSSQRIKRGKRYHNGLSDIPGLIVPPLREEFSHIYTYFPIQYAKRERLLKYAMRSGCDIAAQHYKNNADLPEFAEFYRDCPNAAAVADQLIFLPSYPRYPMRDVERNIRVIRRFFELEV